MKAALLFLWLVVPLSMAFADPLSWEKLPSIPDREGFAAPFAGVSGGALLVAGGANIPGEKWGETFAKKWYDDVYAFEDAWRRIGQLPHPLAYGVSVTFEESVLIFGGSNEQGHRDEVLRLRRSGETTTELPPLPRRCANMCGALLDGVVYLAGGLESPAASEALHTFWALDLKESAPRWRELEPWPGPERMLAVAGVAEGAFYLFSGARLRGDAEGKLKREYLRDAWRYRPGEGWARLPDLPRPAVAAVSPAPWRDGALLIISGDDGANVDFQPPPKHPGFPREVLALDLAHGTWSTSEAPISRATVPAVAWRGGWAIPNGEVFPRIRTPEVWLLR